MAYDIVPPSYPIGLKDKEIRRVIADLQKGMEGNTKVDAIVVNRTALIQVGQNELTSRFMKRTSYTAIGISILALIISLVSLLKY